MITGEPMPEEKSTGGQVYAGTVNLGGLLRIRATGVGADTTLARIIARVEEAQEEKAPTQRFIEKFAAWYTPGIIALSIVVYLISRQIELALTLLVIACPGALVISTPVSIIAGIGQSARRGILIKGGEHLENAGRISALALDKTGTLTYGKPYLSEITALAAQAVAAGGQAPLCTDPTCRWSSPQQEVLYWAASPRMDPNTRWRKPSCRPLKNWVIFRCPTTLKLKQAEVFERSTRGEKSWLARRPGWKKQGWECQMD
jgi:cation transport ATPase